jgi:hypothetical protein
LRGLPLVLGRRARLLTNTTLRNQLLSLERRVVDGHEQVDHPKVANAHDDVAAAAMGALVTVSTHSGYTLEPFQPGFVDYDARPQPAAQQPAPSPAYFGTAEWWRSMPRQEPTYSANERLASLYRGLDRGFKNGF